MILPDLLARRAALTPDAVAFRDPPREEGLTYGAFDRRVGQAARVLCDLGLTPGERLALLCRNRVEFFELLFACARAGVVMVPLNWRMPAAELAHLLADATPSALAFGREDATTATALSGTVSTLIALDPPIGESPTAVPYVGARVAASPLEVHRPWQEDACWYLIYTSGTTGRPKGVIYTFGMALANYVNIRQGMQISADDVTLNFLPLFHTAGINLVTLPTLFEGGSVVLMPGFDVDRVVALIEAGSLDTVFGVPAVFSQLSQHPRFDDLDLTRVRAWGCGGAPLPTSLLERYLARGAKVCNGMGMTETGPTAFLMDADHVHEKIGAVGKPQLLVQARIMDAQGMTCEDGAHGEICFAGPGVTPGYWRQPDATAAAFTNDGWLRSGDVGYRDGDGYYYVVGRRKEMFISGGENVYPVEIENVLVGHPAVLDAAVIGVEDDTWGEVGVAFLCAVHGRELPDDHQLRDYCREHLAAYKVPKRFIHVTEFPRTAAGKIRKHLLSVSD